MKSNAALSMPSIFLRVEGTAIFLGAILAYAQQGASGLLFIALLFVPDVSMLGYVANKQLGALVYNIGHQIALPLMLIGVGVVASTPLAIQIGLIWIAHIGMDRIVGYGFKYASAFKETHMQRV
jgi:uncharacterized membrane protein